MTPNEMLADVVLSGKVLVGRYLAGFDDATALRQAPGLPNHVVWSLGHLALTMHRVAGMIDGGTLPGEAFAAAGEAPGPGRFASESVSFGSVVAGDSARYPSMTRAVEIFHGACDRLASAVRGASEEKMREMVPWGGTQTPLYLLVGRMMFHNGFHTGQIADLRRAFGFKSVFA